MTNAVSDPVNEMLPLPKLATLGLQHVPVMYAGAPRFPLVGDWHDRHIGNGNDRVETMTASNVDFWTSACFVYACVLISLTAWLMRSIRLEDPVLWKQLGSPSVAHLEGTFAIYLFWKWVFSRKSRSDSLQQKTIVLLLIVRIGTVLYLFVLCAMATRSALSI